MHAPMVQAGWLAAHRDEVVVADVRWYLDGRSGRAVYRAGHIPGAVFVDIDRDLAAPPSPAGGRHPLPDPEAFAAAMGAVGIGDHTAVVGYDDTGGPTAARLWWMLDVLGRRAAVLDGGIQAWGGTLATGDEHLPPAHFTPAPWPTDRLADADAAATAGLLLDARAKERYAGDVEPVDPRRGHVPGALSAPWAGNLDPATGRLKAPEVLRARFVALGAREDGDTVAYCGSGINACHDLLAMRVAGLPARLYAGSWSQWSADPARPVATGPDPG